MTETPDDDVTETTDAPMDREPTPPDGEITDVPNVTSHLVQVDGPPPEGGYPIAASVERTWTHHGGH